jgi:peptidoglycan/xylan/chitin deacetylase (PgdA/CDA1 family)
LKSAAVAAQHLQAATAVPDKQIVLTFDDAMKSHRTFVAPFLRELGFGGTFFITHRWMEDEEHFLTWPEIAEIHRMGFEVGNHSWTHANFAVPRNAARLNGEMALLDRELKQVGIPRPMSFAYSGSAFGPEAVSQLRAMGYRFARRGTQPDLAAGRVEAGPAFDPSRHHPLLIPTTGDVTPNSSLDYFRSVVSEARNGRIVVLRYSGVSDSSHQRIDWQPERFREQMSYLKRNGFRATSVRDLEVFTNSDRPPSDPLLTARYPQSKKLMLPVEAEETRARLQYWLSSMITDHNYSSDEVALVTGLARTEVERKISEWKVPKEPANLGLRIRPYPGGRHPRIEFQEGAVNPLRGTKTSVFLPWDPAAYVVVDVPEVLFVDLDRIFLAHTYIPTMWNRQNIVIENVDWQPTEDGLKSEWSLPNGVRFGASVRLVQQQVDLELWLSNGTDIPLRKLRGQVCVMLKGAPEFNALTDENKILRSPVTAVRSATGNRWILTEWENPWRVWTNKRCPCMHSDPVLPDCAPGQTVRVRGRLWFHEGLNVDSAIRR